MNGRPASPEAASPVAECPAKHSKKHLGWDVDHGAGAFGDAGMAELTERHRYAPVETTKLASWGVEPSMPMK